MPFKMFWGINSGSSIFTVCHNGRSRFLLVIYNMCTHDFMLLQTSAHHYMQSDVFNKGQLQNTSLKGPSEVIHQTLASFKLPLLCTNKLFMEFLSTPLAGTC